MIRWWAVVYGGEGDKIKLPEKGPKTCRLDKKGVAKFIDLINYVFWTSSVFSPGGIFRTSRERCEAEMLRRTLKGRGD